MDINGTRRLGLIFPGCINEQFGAFQVEMSFWRHAAQYTAAADSDIAVLVGKKNRRADSLISAAGGIRAVDSGKNRNAELLQFGMPEKCSPAAAPIGIKLLLIRQFHAAAIHKPDQGNIQTF